MPLTPNQIKEQARRFHIWREGTAVGWDCTFVELGAAVGMAPSSVRKICNARGWVTRSDASVRGANVRISMPSVDCGFKQHEAVLRNSDRSLLEEYDYELLD